MHPSLTPYSIASLGTALGAPAEGNSPLIAGVLSGTSADGIDVVLARPVVRLVEGAAPVIDELECVAFATEPFEASLAERIRAVLGGERLSLGEIAVLDRDLGLAFGEAARRVSDRHGLGTLGLVASHGQTVFHHDGRPEFGRVTMQLGDGDFVAEAAGVPVVSDFRVRDCAAGGEGAPLVGLVDDLLFRRAPRPLAILNLGGISNWTLLGKALGADSAGDRGALAFDAGPAGALLDGLSRRRLGRPYDAGGEVALAGRVAEGQLSQWLGGPKFRALQAEGGAGRPTSTGLDTFDGAWVAGIDGAARAGGLSTEDLMATACALVAEVAARALAGAVGGLNAPGEGVHVAAAGGGIYNVALMGELGRRTEAQLTQAGHSMASFRTSDELGVPPDAREALAFAALGARFLLGLPSSSAVATGAAPGRILGKWSPGSA